MNDGAAIIDDLEILGIFKGFSQRKEKLWLWQKTPNANGQRTVHYALVKRVDALKKRIELKPNNSAGFRFDPSQEIYLYSKQRSVAIKIMALEFSDNFIIFALPKKLNFVQSDLLQEIELIEKENEELHQHERETPRKLAANDQSVGLRRILAPEKYSPVFIYKLYDMSQGGMAFEIYDPAEFQIGDELVVLYIDSRPLKQALYGTVVSVRQLPDHHDTFKVGVQFK